MEFTFHPHSDSGKVMLLRFLLTDEETELQQGGSEAELGFELKHSGSESIFSHCATLHLSRQHGLKRFRPFVGTCRHP